MSEKATARNPYLTLSLCALLVLVSLVGVAHIWVDSAVRQRTAVAALTRLPASSEDSIGGLFVDPYTETSTSDGSVQYSHEVDENCEPITAAPPGPRWLRERLGIDYLASVRGATIHRLTPSAVDAAGRLTNLQRLKVHDRIRPTDGLMHVLPGLMLLEKLEFAGLQVTDDELAAVSKLPRLRTLEIESCPRVGDGGLEHIRKIASLKSLALVGRSEVTDAGLSKLAGLRKLETLKLEIRGRATDAALEQLQSLERLRELSIEPLPAGGLKYLDGFANLQVLNCSGLTDENLAAAAPAPRLQSLSLAKCPQLSAAGLKHLDKFPNLQFLSISVTPGFDNDVLSRVAGIPKLAQLTISFPGSKLTDAGLEALGGAANLRSLSLFWCPQLTDEALAHLARLTGLEELRIIEYGPSQFSAPTVDELRRRLPKCRVNFKGTDYSRLSAVSPR